MSRPVREQIDEARLALVQAGIPPQDAALDAEVLARHILGWDRADLFIRRHLPPPAGFRSGYDAAVTRRLAREPVALITGHREFWGLDFAVTGDVLVPRPETELIVQEVLARSDQRRFGRIVDVGTGSGCIAVALALALPTSRVIAVDLSDRALGVAARNVSKHGVASRLVLVRGNLLDAIGGPVDLIVSNPPYIAQRDRPLLPPEVIDYEPHAALFADEEGLATLRALCEAAPSRLAPGGLLVVEFGAGQEPGVREIVRTGGWSAQIVPDLAGIPRVAVLDRSM